MAIVRVLYIAGGFLFLVFGIAHICVRARLRPGKESGLDDYYHEFEDEHPEYARYNRWLRITLGGAAFGVLLLFLGVVL